MDSPLHFFSDNNSSVEKWLWIELIGFDNAMEDYNVSSFLNNLGFTPNGISILFSSIDFVNMHEEGLKEEKKLSKCHCSYLAHPYNEDRVRQDWTNYQLKCLISEIKKRGIKVFFSIFNTFYNIRNDKLVLEDFGGSHSELWEVTRDGKINPTYQINMLKRFPTGEYYEDYFIEKIRQCLIDYGFDGLQVADGISSGRTALQEGDYSDDMVEQFLVYSGISLPPDIKKCCDGDSERFLKRAKYIWNHLRIQWIEFHVQRWERYFIKLFDAVHSVGSEVLFHSAWTRDPFEAIYRYGIDYKKAVTAGADAVLVNEVSCNVAICSSEDNGYIIKDEYRRKLPYEYASMVMLIKAYLDNTKILTLSPIRDTYEDHDIIHHAPTLMSRYVYTNLNTYIYKNAGFKPCTQGPLYCLSDGLKKHEWDFIRKTWDTGYTNDARNSEGVILVWSDERMHNELDYFIKSRGWHTHKIVYELLYRGIPVNSIVRVNELQNINGTILITNPGLLPTYELETAMEYRNGLQLYFGVPAFCGEERNIKAGIKVSVYSKKEEKELFSREIEYSNNHFGEDLSLVEDPLKGLWTCPLGYSELNNELLSDSVNIVCEMLNIPRVIKHENSCKIICIRLSGNRHRILIGNDDYYYNRPVIDMGKKIISAKVISKYYGYRAFIEGSTFCLKVPGKGMDIVDVETG